MSRLLLAHISDSHFDQNADVDDLVGVHRAFVAAAKGAGVNAIAHAGDFFEGTSTARERLMLAEWIGACCEVAPFFGVKGNHDRALELDLYPMMRTVGSTRCNIVDRPQTVYGEASEGFAFIGLPWFDRAPIAARADAAAAVDVTRIATQDQARALLLGLSAWSHEARRLRRVPVLVAHAMIGGSEVSTGQMILGQTVEVSPADLLTSQAEAVILGHVHKHQEWENGRVAYSGSPRRADHGEPEAKGWRLLVFEDGHFETAEFHKLPARELVHVDLDFTGDRRELAHDLREVLLPINKKTPFTNARVRVRYRIAARDLALVNKDLIKQLVMSSLAHDVKIEALPEPEDRVRAVEVVTERTLSGKVKGYLQAKGITTSRWPEIEAKLGEIEVSE